MPLRAHIAALVLAVSSGPALATDLVGYSEAFDTLYRIDLSAHTAQEVGPAGYLSGRRIANIEGLTYSPGGQLYAVSDTLKALLQINPETGVATVVGPLDLAGQSITQQLDLGLAFSCDGNLWLSAGNGKFWQVNPATGTTTPVGDLGVKITGLAWSGNQLFGTGSQGNNNLYVIDTATANTTLVGAYGDQASYVTTASPGFDASGQLRAILAYVPPQPGSTSVPEWSDLALLDTSSGALTNTGNITGDAHLQIDFLGGLKGLAIAPSSCLANRPGDDPAPALSWIGMAAMMTLLALIAGTRLGGRRPNA